jgi:hypothetical protein
VHSHLLLVDHVAFWLCQNALKVSSSQAPQLNTDRQPTLQQQQQQQTATLKGLYRATSMNGRWHCITYAANKLPAAYHVGTTTSCTQPVT